MVAIVAGNGLGLFNASSSILGSAGVLGLGMLGQSGGRALVNAATGNLILQFQDEQMSGRGADLFHLRTYNSLGKVDGLFTDGDADGWRWDGERSLKFSGTANQRNVSGTVTRTAADGHTTDYTWDSATQRYVSTEGSGAHDSVKHDSSTNQWVWTDDSTRLEERYGNSVSNSIGRLAKQVDVSGNAIDYVYTGDKLTSVTDHGSGQFIELVYTGTPAKLSQVNTHALLANGSVGAAVKQVEYTYLTGRLETVKTVLNPGEATESFYTTTYNYEGSSTRISSILQGDGSRVDFTYDGQDRILTVEDASGKQTFTYVSATQTNISFDVGDGSPKVWSYFYDGSKRLTQVQSPPPVAGGAQLVTAFHYDASGNVDEIIDARGFKVVYEYDAQGNRTLERDAEGNTITRTYDSNNQVITETRYRVADPDGAGTGQPSEPMTTQFVYDASSRLRFVISAEGRVSESRYGTGTADSGLLVRTIQYAGARYDAANVSESLLTTWAANLTDKTQAQQTQYEYDFRGDLSKRTDFATVASNGNGTLDAAATVTEYIYDPHGRLLKTIAVRGSNRDQRAELTVFTYDGMGRERSRTNSSGTRMTATAYDGTNKTITVTTNITDATSRIETRAFDDRGRLLGVTQAAGEITRPTTYVYDPAGRLRMKVDALGGRHFSFYDAAGRVLYQVDSGGAATGFEYNATGQLIKQTRYANAARNIGSWVNNATNPTQVIKHALTLGAASGDLEPKAAEDRITLYEYDKAGRLTTQTEMTAAANVVTNTSYDGASRITQQQTSDRITRYFHDRDGRQIGVVDPLGYLTENKFDAAGRLVETVRYNTRSPSASNVAAPVWVGTSNSSVIQSVSGDRSLSYRVSAFDPDGDSLTFSLIGSKPSWLNVDTTAVGGVMLSGKPPVSFSSYDITLRAADGRGRTTDTTVSITVSVDNHGPTWIVVPGQQRLAAGQPFRFTVPTAQDPDGHALTYSILKKPSWLQFNAATLELSGTPPAESAGAHTVEVQVLDPFGASATLTLNLNVFVNSPPTWASLSPFVAILGYHSAYTPPRAVDPEGEALTYSVVSGLPAEMGFDPATGSLGSHSGSNLIWGDYTVVLRVTDPHGASVDRTLAVYVRDITDPPPFVMAGTDAARFAAIAPADDVLASWRPAASTDDLHSYQYYDAQGRMVGSVDEQGFLTERVYDAHTNKELTRRYETALTVSGSDTLGDLKGRAGPVRTSTVEYNAMGLVLKRTDVHGTVTRYEYDGLDRLVREVRAFETNEARASRIRYNNFDEVTGTVGGEGDASGLSTGDAIAQYGMRYEYDSEGRRTKAIDARGNVTLLYYDREGQLTHTINAKGEVSETVYNRFGQVESTRRYALRIAAAVMTEAPPPQWLRGGFASDLLLSEVAKLAVPDKDRLTTYSYDQRGLLSTTTDGERFKTTNTYNAFGQLETQIRTILQDARSKTTKTQFDYDLRGALLSTTADVGGVNFNTQAVHDAFGRVIKSIDAAGKVTSTSYQDSGRAIEVMLQVNGAQRKVRTEYDAFARVLKQIDASGKQTAYTYDDAARSVSVTTPEGVTVKTTKTRHGETLSVVDGRNNTTSYEYNKDGQLRKVTDALGKVVTDNEYAKSGLLSQTKDARGVVTTFSYDAVNRMFERVLDPSGLNLVTTYQFNGFGDHLTMTEGVGNNAGANITRVTSYKYDRNGRLTQVITDPGTLKLTTTYEYDGFGNTIRVARGSLGNLNQQVTLYEFDKLGRRVKEIAAPSAVFGAGSARERDLTTEYRYDAAGRVSRKIDALGQSTWFVYDEAGELTHTVNAEGEVSRSFHDANGRVVRTHRYAARLSASTLAALGDVASVNTVTPGINGTDQVSYFVYDDDGRLRYTLQYLSDKWSINESRYDKNDNVIETRRYDKALTDGRVAAMTSDGQILDLITVAEVTGELLTTLQYDDSKASTLAKIQRTRFAYDVNNRLRFTVDALGTVSENAYDKAGNVIAKIRYATPPGLTAYDESTIDAAVNRANTANQVSRFVYDAAGRQAYGVRVSGFNGSDQALHVVSRQVYDALGRVVQSLAYANEMTLADYELATLDSAVVANKSVQDRRSAFAYDAAGHQVYSVRAAEINGEGVATKHLVSKREYDALGQVISSTDYATRITATLSNYKKETLDTAAAAIVNATHDRTTTFIYDKAGRQRFVVAADGSLGETLYDALGQVTQRRQFDFTLSTATPRTEQDLAERRAARAVGDGATRGEKYTYDRAGRVLTTTDAKNVVQTYGYDAMGNRTSFINRNGDEWTYTYDRLGQLRTEVSPEVEVQLSDGTKSARKLTTFREYDAFGNLIRRTEANGTIDARATSYDYDTLGRLELTTLPGFYDPQTGKVEKVTATGRFQRSIQVIYDALGNSVRTKTRIAAGTAPGSFQNEYKTYDALGRVVHDVDALKHATGFTYNAFGEQLTVTRNGVTVSGAPANANFWLASEIAGQVSGDSAARTIAMKYDNLGRKIEVTQPALGRYYRTGDQPGAVPSAVTPPGTPPSPITKYEYNVFGEIQRESIRISADDRWRDTWHYFDTRGREIRTIDTLGHHTAHAYDALGNLQETVEFATAGSAGSSALAPPVMPSESSKDRITAFTYDALNRRQTIQRKNLTFTQWNGSEYVQVNAGRPVAKTVASLTYDNEGRVKKQTDALGNVTTTDYNKLGQVTKVTEPARVMAEAGVDPFLNQVQRSPLTTLTLNAFGQVVTQERSPGGSGESLFTVNQYDFAGNLLRTSDPNRSAINPNNGTLVTDHTYDKVRQYDFAGRVIKETQAINVTLGDWLRPDRTVGSWQNVSHTLERRYAYDASGRQTHALDVFMEGTTLKQSGQRSVFNAFGEVTEERRVAGTASAALGGLTEITSATYGYDQGGRLITRQAADGRTEYFYDLTGQVTRQEQRDNKASNDGNGGLVPTRVTETFYDDLGRAKLRRLPSFDALLTGASSATRVTPTMEQQYDRWGNVISRGQGRFYDNATSAVVSSELRTTQYEYNHDNKITLEMLPQVKVVRANGTDYQAKLIHGLRYDVLGRVVAEFDAADDVATAVNEALTPLRTRSKEYNEVGQLIVQTDATGHRTSYVYDAHGNRVGTKNALGVALVDTFDKNGNLTSHGILRGAAVKVLNRYQYDQANRRVATEEITDQFIVGSLVSNWTFAQYDERNFVRSTFNIRALPVVSDVLTLDPGRVLNVCVYDAFGHKTSETDVLENTRTWTYNTTAGLNFNFGQLDSTTVGGRTTQYAYNDLGQLSRELYSGTGISTAAGKVTDRSYHYHDNGLLKKLTDHAFYGTEGMTGGADYMTLTDITDYDYTVNGERAREAYTRTGTAENGIYAFNDQSGEFDLTSVSAPTTIAGITRTTTTQYDALGRMTQVKTPTNTNRTLLTSLEYEYDELSNRRHIKAQYTLPGAQPSDKWYTYDAEGRVTIVDGVLSSGEIKAVSGSTRVTYDGLGRRRTAEKFVDLFGMTGKPRAAGEERPDWMHFNGALESDETITGKEYHEELYTYNDLNYLDKVEQRANFRDVKRQVGSDPPPSEPNMGDQEGTWVISATRSNDLQGRVHNTTQYANIHLNATGNQSAPIQLRTVAADYNARGLMFHQTTTQWRSHNGEAQVESISHVDNSFDAAGILRSYTYRVLNADDSVNYTNTYEYDYTDEFGGFKEARITVKSTRQDTGRGETQNQYDARGNLIRQTIANSEGTRTSTFAYNADGQVTSKDEFLTKTNGELPTSERGSADYFYVSGHQIGAVGSGKLASTTQFTSDFTPISAAYPSTSPGSYTVNAQDSLASIALSIFGDASLWYLIADANSLSFGPSDTLPSTEIGKTYRIPNVVTGSHNNASTFAPYNPAHIIGDSTPFPGTPAPPAAQCGDQVARVLAIAVVVAAAAVVTAYTGGMASYAMGAVLGEGLAATAVGAGIGAAAGSTVSQLGMIGVTGGKLSDFSGKQVLASGLAGAFSGIATDALSGLANSGGLFGAVTSRAGNYFSGEIASQLVGLDTPSFGAAVTQLGINSLLNMPASGAATKDTGWSGALAQVAYGALNPDTGWFTNRSGDWANIASGVLNPFAGELGGRIGGGLARATIDSSKETRRGTAVESDHDRITDRLPSALQEERMMASGLQLSGDSLFAGVSWAQRHRRASSEQFLFEPASLTIAGEEGFTDVPLAPAGITREDYLGERNIADGKVIHRWRTENGTVQGTYWQSGTPNRETTRPVGNWEYTRADEVAPYAEVSPRTGAVSYPDTALEVDFSAAIQVTVSDEEKDRIASLVAIQGIANYYSTMAAAKRQLADFHNANMPSIASAYKINPDHYSLEDLIYFGRIKPLAKWKESYQTEFAKNGRDADTSTLYGATQWTVNAINYTATAFIPETPGDVAATLLPLAPKFLPKRSASLTIPLAETEPLAARSLQAALGRSSLDEALAPQKGLGDWFFFRRDQGGSATTTHHLGPYPGRLGALLDKVGIRQGMASHIINEDAIKNGSWFARTDTRWHEGLHGWTARYLPTFRELSHTDRIWGAAFRYPEEVAAYAFGHAGALRLHAIPLAPLEAFTSLSRYSVRQQVFAAGVWGSVGAGAGGYGLSKVLDHFAPQGAQRDGAQR